ncbi:hypothetical protein Mal15_07630 [Stieleria maiorica]|uniref:Uncharacterized protein n=1 Tax=Stieleria maiorica TaxID=2795974 RepID=A0A5B9MB14_9BACT|nr:hypothetical protein Mal15_07630 [Stieleria maiorica]
MEASATKTASPPRPFSRNTDADPKRLSGNPDRDIRFRFHLRDEHHAALNIDNDYHWSSIAWAFPVYGKVHEFTT